jgi:hypothetical protein
MVNSCGLRALVSWIQRELCVSAQASDTHSSRLPALPARRHPQPTYPPIQLTRPPPPSSPLLGRFCSAAAITHHAEVPKLPTPPKERPATQLPTVKVPPLKLGGVGGAAAASAAARDENADAGNAAALAGAPVADKASGKGKKGGSMHFLPGKKVRPVCVFTVSVCVCC